MNDEWENALPVVASIYQLLYERRTFALRMERAWHLIGFRGIAALARTTAGRQLSEHGQLASGVSVISIRCEHEGRGALVRYFSDGRKFTRALKVPLTDVYDAVFDLAGFDGIKRLYASDILAHGSSKLIRCERPDGDDEEIFALADVIGCRLVLTMYSSKTGRTQKSV